MLTKTSRSLNWKHKMSQSFRRPCPGEHFAGWPMFQTHCKGDCAQWTATPPCTPRFYIRLQSSRERQAWAVIRLWEAATAVGEWQLLVCDDFHKLGFRITFIPFTYPIFSYQINGNFFDNSQCCVNFCFIHSAQYSWQLVEAFLI